ncbi:MAG TPA: Ig domain-containing protein [Planctomycetota bacterium]
MRIAIALLALLPGPGDEALQPWGSNKHASDAPKSRAEDITASKHAYTVVQGGTMDGRSCRSPMGVGMSREGALEQTWESNRAVRMENVGETDILNPWLSNGQNNLRSFEEIVAAAVAPGMTDAEKATALWHQRIKYRYHFGASDASEEADLVKSLHIYGYNTCGHDSMMMSELWKQAGLKSAPARGVGHCISQVFYDGKWHLYDGDMKSVFLNRDNETVAGEQDIVRDHDLIKRTHSQGILLPDNRGSNEWMAALYGFEGEVKGQRGGYRDGNVKMTLRPGEALVWRWGHLTPLKFHGRQALYPDTICNGLWEYRPDFSKDAWRKGAAVDGVKSTPAGLTEGTIAWTLKAPYVMVGGRILADGQGAEFSFSWDGKTWEPLGDFDKRFAYSDGKGRYGYQLRCKLSGAATLKSLAIVNDLQMAPLLLPEMGVGTNAFTYTDESPSRKARITHEWVERSASKPPLASAGALYPPDKGEAAGTDVVFKWAPASDPDGDKIADYQFELSNRADLRWPLSMTFFKLISKTADKGQAQYALPEPGLLTGDRAYHWRVRAKDAKGVWGPWSATWSFTAKAPNYPVEVALESGTLRWKPNPAGRKPALYRVYGSDEKGFSVSDKPYNVTVGICKELPNPFPANFIAETKSTELAVAGKTYYRVVAVDDAGKRSGPSDYVTGPRPAIYSAAVTTAKAGAPYSYAVLANRSIGDLKLRQVGGRDTANFWDIEKLQFALVKGPEWLKIDAATGVLSGTPPAAGAFEVEVTATLDREVRKLDGDVLAWGNEKVISTGVERVGVATQRFTLTVAP